MRRAAVVLLGLVVLAGCSSEPAAPEGDPCNGHAALCDRAYDDVAFPAVCPGTSNTRALWPPSETMSPSPTARSMPGIFPASARGPITVQPVESLSAAFPPA